MSKRIVMTLDELEEWLKGLDAKRTQAQALRMWLRDNDMYGMECSQTVELERVNDEIRVTSVVLMAALPTLIKVAHSTNYLSLELEVQT